MGLTKQDLADIRSVTTEVVMEALEEVVNPRLDALEQEMRENSVVLNEHTRLHHEHANRLRILTDKSDDILGRLEAVEVDIKELYNLFDAGTPFDKKFVHLPPEQKVRKLHAAVLALAEQLHVEL